MSQKASNDQLVIYLAILHRVVEQTELELSSAGMVRDGDELRFVFHTHEMLPSLMIGIANNAPYRALDVEEVAGKMLKTLTQEHERQRAKMRAAFEGGAS